MIAAAVGSVALRDAALFLVPFLARNLVWGLSLSAATAWERRFATRRVFRIVDAMCGLAFGSFGLRLHWSPIRDYGRWFAFARPLLP